MDPVLAGRLLIDLIDFGFYSGMGVAGWDMAHHAEKCVRLLSFGKPPTSRIYIRVTRIVGWLAVASACLCIALFPFTTIFEIYARR